MGVAERLRAAPTRPEAAPALFRLLAEASLSRAALDACGTPVALVDAAGASHPISYVNQAFESCFGLRAAEALGRPAIDLLFVEPASAAALLGGSAARARALARRKDGSPLPVDVAVGTVRGSDGRVSHWVLSFAEREETAGPR
jgi:PAS domain S-box-containing protein